MTTTLDREHLPCVGTPPPAPFVAGSETSRAAAEAIAPHVNALQLRVLKCLARVYPGTTDEDMQETLRLNPSTQRPRRIELVQMGLVRDSGHRARTKSGRTATVWTITEAGRTAYLSHSL